MGRKKSLTGRKFASSTRKREESRQRWRWACECGLGKKQKLWVAVAVAVVVTAEGWGLEKREGFFYFLIFIGEIVFEIMRCGLIGFFFTFTRIDELALHWSHWMLSTVEICAIARDLNPPFTCTSNTTSSCMTTYSTPTRTKHLWNSNIIISSKGGSYVPRPLRRHMFVITNASTSWQ